MVSMRGEKAGTSYAEFCCVDQDEAEKDEFRFRVTPDAWTRMKGEQHYALQDDKDPIDTVENKKKKEYYEADDMFLRAARIDTRTVLYLEDRMKNCYKLRTELGSHGPLLACFKDDQRDPLDCECDVRTYLNHVAKEKQTFAEDVSKHYAPPKKGKGLKKGSMKT